MNTYWMLCDAVHQANEFYGDQLMAVIFSAFIHITIKLYFLFLNVTTGKVLLIISEGAWILTYICFLVVFVNSSTDVTNSFDCAPLQVFLDTASLHTALYNLYPIRERYMIY
ncbi:hypothetical protein J6590_090146 [Homalodisca vitripennis]|nr:hypothetical protein J6590_090146 [Homalodisca vitripennis]